jgi:hypothetical protein
MRKFPTRIAQDRFPTRKSGAVLPKEGRNFGAMERTAATRVQKSEFDVPREEAFAMKEGPVLNPTEARQAVVGHNIRYVLIASSAFVVVAFVAIAFSMTR